MRDYDPTTGRYIEADPLGLVDGASVYGYAFQNPGRYIDPRGLCVGPLAIPCAWGGAAVADWVGGAALAVGTVALSTLSGDTSSSSKAEKAKERKAYSSYCKNPPPPTGDLCKDLENRYLHAKQCLAMREAFSEKWYNDGDHGHQTEIDNWTQRVKNLEDDLREMCPKSCGELGIAQ